VHIVFEILRYLFIADSRRCFTCWVHTLCTTQRSATVKEWVRLLLFSSCILMKRSDLLVCNYLLTVCLSWYLLVFAMLRLESGTPCHSVSVLLPSAENSSGLGSKPTSLSAPTHDSSPPRTIEEYNCLLTYLLSQTLELDLSSIWLLSDMSERLIFMHQLQVGHEWATDLYASVTGRTW